MLVTDIPETSLIFNQLTLLIGREGYINILHDFFHSEYEVNARLLFLRLSKDLNEFG
jgi:hypothetical protein